MFPSGSVTQTLFSWTLGGIWISGSGAGSTIGGGGVELWSDSWINSWMRCGGGVAAVGASQGGSWEPDWLAEPDRLLGEEWLTIEDPVPHWRGRDRIPGVVVEGVLASIEAWYRWPE